MTTRPRRSVNTGHWSAAELLSEPVGIDSRRSAALRRFAIELDELGAFRGLSHMDARYVATEIASDFAQSRRPGRLLFERARKMIGIVMQNDRHSPWDDPQLVYRAMLIASTTALSWDDEGNPG
jgi:hypothetical protein